MYGDHRWAGENNPNAKFSNVQIEEIKTKWLSGLYTRKQFSEEYSKKYNVSKSTICLYSYQAHETLNNEKS